MSGWRRFVKVAVASAVVLSAGSPARAAQVAAPGTATDEVARLRQELDSLRQEYGARMAALEARLAALEAAPTTEAAPGAATPAAPETVAIPEATPAGTPP